MRSRTRLLIVSAFALGTVAQAAELRLGAHAEGYVGGTYGFGLLPDVGIDASLTQPLQQDLALRGKLGVGWGGGMTTTRLDIALLNRRSPDWYYGAGLGTGVLFSNQGSNGYAIFTPLSLANFHVLAGKNFGTAQFEGYVRVWPSYGAGVSLSTLVR